MEPSTGQVQLEGYMGESEGGNAHQDGITEERL